MVCCAPRLSTTVIVWYPDEGETLFRVSEEEQQIIDDAKANGTYLKGPNGKSTNLSPKQQVQVRTQAFKQWFEDWMLAATETPIYT